MRATKNSGNTLLTQFIHEVVRRNIPRGVSDLSRADIYFEEVRLHSPHDPTSGPYIMPIATLRTGPCSWSSRQGCIMCGYCHGASLVPPDNSQLIAQTKDVIGRLDPQTYPAIVFTSNGSFLDPAEVSDNMRPVLLGMLREAGFQFVVVESRLEYITPTRLQAMVHAFCPDTLNGKHKHRVSVSVGLESSNDFILYHCINKGHVREDYIKTFELLRREGFSFDCYVLLGKPFMTAREDVEDAIESIRFAVDNGADYVFVMVTNLVDNTLTKYLNDHGHYRVPSLWRAVTLLEMLPEDYRKFVQIKGISHAPVRPLLYATTCEACEREMRAAVNFWNQTGDFEHIRTIEPCSCKDRFLDREWAVSPGTTLKQRVDSEYVWLRERLQYYRTSGVQDMACNVSSIRRAMS